MVPGLLLVVAFPPQASAPLTTKARSTSMPTIARQFRRRLGIQKNSRQASADPSVAYQRPDGRAGYSTAPEVAAVVVMVSVAVAALAPEMLTGLLDPKLKLGGYWAPLGLDVIAALRVTLPVKPPEGVTVIVEVFPVVAPGATVTLAPLIENPGLTAVVTVTVFDPDAPPYLEALEESGV